MTYARSFLLIAIISMSLSSLAQSIADLNTQRVQLVVKAFNERSDQLVEPLQAENVRIVDGSGRADVNKKAKFSYFIQVENPADPTSRILLIPMATSRFTPTYYQTDEWWDKYKDQKPMPRQPMDEVQKWLEEMKLSSNPDVIVIQPGQKANRLPLRDFLLNEQIERFSQDGKIALFRGAERDGEKELWEKGDRPKGARYWTPTANYAWRYARKQSDFIPRLVEGNAPLFKFKIPISDFKAMALRRWPRLTFGTELTKKAHENFDRSGRFVDHLANNSEYLGEGTLGVEIEVRSNRNGANDMAHYYAGPVTIEDLANDRIHVLEKALRRMVRQRPSEAETLRTQIENRIEIIRAEAELLLRLQKKSGSEAGLNALLEKIPRRELTNIDSFDLNSYVAQKIHEGGFSPIERPGLFHEKALVLRCEGVFL